MNIKNLVVGKLRKTILIIFDIACIAFIASLYYISNILFESPFVYQTEKFFINMGILIATIMLSRVILGVYSSVWRYTTVTDFAPLCSSRAAL